METIPSLTFFCELPSDKLKKYLNDPKTIRQLQQLHANISMGLLDFSSERAAIVKQLTKAGIPVTAWLLLPKNEGYWTSLDSVPATIRVYGEFKDWTRKNKLQWAAIGLDIEPRIDRMQSFGKSWYRSLPNIFSRLISDRKYSALENDLRALINIIRMDGFAIETYNFPFVVDERAADSRILAKALGTPPLNADREVLMLYSSFFNKFGDAILYSYASQAEGIGLGSTGGGVELENGEPLKSMQWEDLRRDLLISKNFTQHIYIFSLEGCVENNYLEKLITFNWVGKVHLPIQTGQSISILRKTIQGILWMFSHPLVILLPILFYKSIRIKK